ncbi:hypothetical protein FB45DRAFT_929962, partial [Roridomyces roridus]
MSVNPLHTPELLYHTISFVHALQDLYACALGSRSWVYPAQSQLFCEISLSWYRDATSASSAATLFRRLADLLEGSPHLSLLIADLYIALEVFDAEILTKLSKLSFPRLFTLAMFSFTPFAAESVPPMRHLLGSPSLRMLSLSLSFATPECFVRIWEECAPGIKTLWLRVEAPWHSPESDELPTTDNMSFTRRPVRISLESLDVDCTELRKVQWWLDSPCCPFEFSGLKALRFGCSMQHLRASALSQAFPSVELARIDALFGASEPVDLSVFERLVQLDVDYADLLSIRTIRPQSRHLLRVLRIRVGDGEYDAIFAGLDHHCISTLHEEFANLTMVYVAADAAAPRFARSVEEYFPQSKIPVCLEWI